MDDGTGFTGSIQRHDLPVHPYRDVDGQATVSTMNHRRGSRSGYIVATKNTPIPSRFPRTIHVYLKGEKLALASTKQM